MISYEGFLRKVCGHHMADGLGATHLFSRHDPNRNHGCIRIPHICEDCKLRRHVLCYWFTGHHLLCSRPINKLVNFSICLYCVGRKWITMNYKYCFFLKLLPGCLVRQKANHTIKLSPLSPCTIDAWTVVCPVAGLASSFEETLGHSSTLCQRFGSTLSQRRSKSQLECWRQGVGTITFTENITCLGEIPLTKL